MNLREKIAAALLCIASYLVLPYLTLYFFPIEELNKAGFLIFTIVTFSSFAINIVITYLRGKDISLPIISSIISLPLYFLFNISALLLIVLIVLMSFLGYFLGGIFTKKEEKND